MEYPHGCPDRGLFSCPKRGGGMAHEVKFVSFAEFKARTEGPGGWEGYLSKTGEIDDGGDLIAQGAYADTIPEFLSRGFNAESHDWAFSKMIGFPISAKEDDEGLYTVSQYHSTPDAQLVRVKAQERIAAGKGVYMSIGWEPAAAPIIVQPDEYKARIPEFSRKGMEETNLLKALEFPFIRVLPKVNLFEGSIVSVPMLRSAEVTAVKSADSDSLLAGMTLEDEGRQTLGSVESYKNRLIEIVHLAREGKVGAAISAARRERIRALREAIADMGAELDALLEETTPKPKDDEEETRKQLAIEIMRIVQRDSARRGVPIK